MVSDSNRRERVLPPCLCQLHFLQCPPLQTWLFSVLFNQECMACIYSYALKLTKEVSLKYCVVHVSTQTYHTLMHVDACIHKYDLHVQNHIDMCINLVNIWPVWKRGSAITTFLMAVLKAALLPALMACQRSPP